MADDCHPSRDPIKEDAGWSHFISRTHRDAAALGVTESIPGYNQRTTVAELNPDSAIFIDSRICWNDKL